MKRNIAILSTILIALSAVFFIKTNNTTKFQEEVNAGEIEEPIIKENQEDEVDLNKFDNVINVALLGLDGNGYGKDKRSDVVIIATVNTITNSLELTSVSRDTLVYHPDSGKYDKLNHAYPKNGSKGVVNTLNSNLDIDIEHHVTFDYNSVIKAVDFFGGYPADVTEAEAKDMAREGDIVEPGKQMLTGEQALTYVRIRKNSGGDPGRNQRQRDLIVYIMKQSQSMSKSELLSFSTKMLPLVKTSYSFLDVKDLLDLYVSMRNGLQVNQYTYPIEYKGGLLKDKVWYAVPNTVEDNVIEFHEEILQDYNYYPSPLINEINKETEEILRTKRK